MANNSTSLANLPPKLIADSSDQIVIYSSVSNGDFITPVGNLFSNSILSVANLTIAVGNTPANSTINCIAGSFWSDGNYLYYAVATNTLKRIAMSPF